MKGRRWTRIEDLAVLFLRVEYHDELRSPQNHPLVHSLTDAIDRSVASVTMRIGNFNYLDPSIRGKGLTSTTTLTEQFWAEYVNDPKRILSEGRKAFFELVQI